MKFHDIFREACPDLSITEPEMESKPLANSCDDLGRSRESALQSTCGHHITLLIRSGHTSSDHLYLEAFGIIYPAG